MSCFKNKTKKKPSERTERAEDVLEEPKTTHETRSGSGAALFVFVDSRPIS